MTPSDENPLATPGGWDRELQAIDPALQMAFADGLLGRRLRREVTAEDVYNQAVLRALSSPMSWQGRAKFAAWFRTIIRHVVEDLGRHVDAKMRGGGKPTVPFSVVEAGSEISAFHGAIVTTTPSRLAVHSERKAAMLEALEELPEDLRTVFWLRHFEGADNRTVARQLNLPQTTIRSRFRRAAETFRRVLETRITTAHSRPSSAG